MSKTCSEGSANVSCTILFYTHDSIEVPIAGFYQTKFPSISICWCFEADSHLLELELEGEPHLMPALEKTT